MKHLRAPLLLTATLLTVSSAALADETPALRVDTMGAAAVRFHRQLPWRPLAASAQLKMGQQLRCEQGCTLTAADGSSYQLAAGAAVVVESPRFARLDPTPDSMAVRCNTLRLIEGSVRVTRPSALSAPLIVVSPVAPPVAVLGLVARVATTTDGAAVEARDSVALRRPTGWRMLDSGKTYRVRRDGRSEARQIISAPTWRNDGDLQRPIGLATTKPAASVASSWSPVPGAARYRIVISEAGAEGETVARFEVPASQTAFETTLREGRYWAQLTAIDADGLEADASVRRALRVVRVSLPAGAFMADARTLVVPEGRSVRLLDTEQLELSVDKSGFWPAPTGVRGPAKPSHRLRLRSAGEPSTTTSLRIERRALKADVALSTSDAATASQPVSASVTIADPSGRIDPATIVPQLEVRLGGKLLAAEWQRDGDVWRASIKGTAHGKPSLLEVIARDDSGTALGRAYVEMLGDSEENER